MLLLGKQRRDGQVVCLYSLDRCDGKIDGLMLTVVADALSLGHWAVLGVVTGFTTVLNCISNGSGCYSGKLT